MSIVLDDAYRTIESTSLSFDLFVCALGFESRSTHAAQVFVGKYESGICFRFKDRNCLNFSSNQDRLLSLQFEFLEWPSAHIRQDFSIFLRRHLEAQNGLLRVGIDISSMTRQLAAELVYTISNRVVKDMEQIQITLLYSPAEFIEPKELLVPVDTIGPVLPEYAGWTSRPERPTYAVVGLGYEYGRAIGALDYLDPSDIWLFRPVGRDDRYRNFVESINKDLVSSLDETRLVDYFVTDPYDTFIRMRSLFEGLLSSGRIVVIPFGPKLFNTLALILAEILGKDVAVWRVSSTISEEPIDRTASGEVLSFSFTVKPTTL